MNKIRMWLSKLLYYQDDKLLDILDNHIHLEQYNLNEFGVPIKTGRKVNGKWEYVMKLDFGMLPNNTSKSINIPLDFNNVTLTAPIRAWGKSEINEYIPIPRYSNASSFINFYISGGGLAITTVGDSSRFHAYIELYFTYNQEV